VIPSHATEPPGPPKSAEATLLLANDNEFDIRKGRERQEELCQLCRIFFEFVDTIDEKTDLE
jgi:hypothetical protein